MACTRGIREALLRDVGEMVKETLFPIPFHILSTKVQFETNCIVDIANYVLWTILSGRVMWNVLPTPFLLSNHISPPCLRTTSLLV